jgi:hypothetical protein
VALNPSSVTGKVTTSFRRRWRLLALATLVLLIATAVSPAGYSLP